MRWGHGFLSPFERLGEIVIKTLLWCYLRNTRKWGKVTFYSAWLIKQPKFEVHGNLQKKTLFQLQGYHIQKPDKEKTRFWLFFSRYICYTEFLDKHTHTQIYSWGNCGLYWTSAESQLHAWTKASIPKISHKNFLYCVLCVLNKMQY